MKSLWQDVRFGIRMLVKNPVVTFVAVITLALGIGANTAIFSVVNAVLLHSLPYGDSDRLVTVWEKKQERDQNTINLGNFSDWKEQNRVFEDMAAFFDLSSNLTSDGEPEEVPAQVATPNLFSLLGVNAVIGRTFTPEDGKPGQPRVVVISAGLWGRRFGGGQVIGRKVMLNNQEATVIGVLPADFAWHLKKNSMTGKPAEMWFPWQITNEMRERHGRFAAAVARLKPGITLVQAQAEMDAIGARLEQQYPEFNTSWGVNVVPLRTQFTGDIRKPLLILLGAVGFVLLIACANVANLLLARAASRQKEIALRAGLGASRGRIVRQLLTESALLSALGGGAGLLLAWWGTRALVALSPPELLDLAQVRISLPVLAFTRLCYHRNHLWVVPALEATRFDRRDPSRRAAYRRCSHRFRTFLVAKWRWPWFCWWERLLLKSPTVCKPSIPDHPRNLLTMRNSLPRRKYDTDPSHRFRTPDRPDEGLAWCRGSRSYQPPPLPVPPGTLVEIDAASAGGSGTPVFA
jgi:putative ABC transport system permease protein